MLSFYVILLGWLAFNLAFAGAAVYLSSRWGRDPFGWFLSAALLGPFAFLTLIALRRDDLRASANAPSHPLTRSVSHSSVLVAFDGSAPSQAAVRWVIDHLGLVATEVTVLTVLPLERSESLTAPEDSPRHQLLESQSATNLAPACDALSAAGMRCMPVTRFGNPADEILALADEGNHELIVLGRRGQSVGKMLLGSVSETVVKNARVPVMVVS